MAIFVPVDVNATGAEFYTPERDTPGNKISYLLLMFFLKKCNRTFTTKNFLCTDTFINNTLGLIILRLLCSFV